MSSPLSPLPRHPLTRPYSPDLPIQDALYLFANFSSYMRSPGEGALGITNSEDFKDTIRLLDYARELAKRPELNCHVLHLKYRFQSPAEVYRSPYASGDYQQPINHLDATGRLRNPVPQPFSVLHDPVVKIDLKESGVFNPLPAEAIFGHISKACQPSPRIIVVSYVGSRVTQNHLAAMSKWALASSPPIHIFSPFETRIRERLPLYKALLHAIPMSMYESVMEPHSVDPSPAPTPARVPSPVVGGACRVGTPLRTEKSGPSPPTLSPPSITTHGLCSTGTVPGSGALTPSESRVPLWTLAPGFNALQGSVSASYGVKLTDFSAVKLKLSDSGESEHEAVWKCLHPIEGAVRVPIPHQGGVEGTRDGQGGGEGEKQSGRNEGGGGGGGGGSVGSRDADTGGSRSEAGVSRTPCPKAQSNAKAYNETPTTALRRSVDSWMASHSPQLRHSINLLDLAGGSMASTVKLGAVAAAGQPAGAGAGAVGSASASLGSESVGGGVIGARPGSAPICEDPAAQGELLSMAMALVSV